jgi:hypothetical protein
MQSFWDTGILSTTVNCSRGRQQQKGSQQQQGLQQQRGDVNFRDARKSREAKRSRDAETFTKNVSTNNSGKIR